MNSGLKQYTRITFNTIKRNKLRSFLSVLGIAIGIMALVVIMSAGQSLRLVFIDELDSFGTDYINVEIKVPNTSQTSSANAAGIAQGISITTLLHDDKDDIDKLDNVSSSYGIVIGQDSMSTLFEERQSNYLAVSSEFDSIDPADLVAGRFYTKEEEDSLGRFAVMGSEAAEELFPNQDPIGQTIRIHKTRFRVIGVFEERGASPFFDLDDMVFIPLKTAQKLLLGFDHMQTIVAQLVDIEQDDITAQEITYLIRDNHEITDPDDDDFAVTTQEEALGIIDTLLDGVTLVVLVIASIALVVGGVGIMNIMYVAVSERFFEIGLRKAVGATASKIRLQFLVESIIVTLLGGFFGILIAGILVISLYYIAAWQGFEWPFAFSFQSIFIAVIFSTGVGVGFGYLPAKKAAQLDPVAALTGRKN